MSHFKKNYWITVFFSRLNCIKTILFRLGPGEPVQFFFMDAKPVLASRPPLTPEFQNVSYFMGAVTISPEGSRTGDNHADIFLDFQFNPV